MSVLDKAKGLFSSAKPTVSEAMDDLGEKVEQVSVWLKEQRANNPAISKISETVDEIGERWEEVRGHWSGAKVLEEAAALLAQQKRYNDVLATRLAEALDKIDVLEKRVSALENIQ